jgi:hypothetical protein
MRGIRSFVRWGNSSTSRRNHSRNYGVPICLDRLPFVSADFVSRIQSINAKSEYLPVADRQRQGRKLCACAALRDSLI